MYKRQIADRIAGSIFVIMGIVCLVEGWRMYPMRTRGIVGDEAFPLVLGFIMVGLGGVLALFPKPQKRSVSWPKANKPSLWQKRGHTGPVLLLLHLGFPQVLLPQQVFSARWEVFGGINAFSFP
jgi:hypothetical protein